MRSKRLLEIVGGALVFISAPLSAQQLEVDTPPFVEREHIHQRNDALVSNAFRRAVESEAKTMLYGLGALQQVIDQPRTWPLAPGLARTNITVAFNGATPELHRQIAAVASQWMDAGNLRLDFGEANGRFRAWHSSDDPRYPAADIRIAFKKGAGYSSVIGNEAVTVVRGNESTMNLDSFDRALPSLWRYLVLHEFGHALGLRHELQHPDQNCRLRWDNEDGYEPERNAARTAIRNADGKRPGIYYYLGSAPNFWSKPEVDKQVGLIKDATNLKLTDFDPDSVMIYPLEPWLFEQTNSPCSVERSVLSPRDKAAIALVYPFTAEGVDTRRQLEAEVLLKTSDLMRMR